MVNIYDVFILLTVPTTESSLDEINADPELLLLEKEPELWVQTVDKEVSIIFI